MNDLIDYKTIVRYNLKYGIITHYDVHNHGALLQLNGLVKVLRNIGVNASALQFEKSYDFLGLEMKAKYEISIKSIDIYLNYLKENGLGQTLYNYKKKKVLEALSCGVPCILTPGTNMADDLSVAGAGWKAEFNAESIADKIMEAVSDLKRNYLLYHEAAYKLSDSYDWKKIAIQHINLMNSILS